MRKLLMRHRMRVITRCLNRWVEHCKLLALEELYYRDMM